MKIIVGIAIATAAVAGAAFLLKKGVDACKKANECCKEAEEKESHLADVTDLKASHEKAEKNRAITEEQDADDAARKADIEQERAEALKSAREDVDNIVKSISDATKQLGTVLKTETATCREEFNKMLDAIKSCAESAEKAATSAETPVEETDNAAESADSTVEDDGIDAPGDEPTEDELSIEPVAEPVIEPAIEPDEVQSTMGTPTVESNVYQASELDPDQLSGDDIEG